MNLTIILLAAGSSQRFKKNNNETEKQFCTIDEKTLLEICIENFIDFNLRANILLVVSKNRLNEAKKISKFYSISPPIIGGTNRQSSVKKALDHINNLNPNNVIIHDVARPIISKNVVNNLINSLKNNLSCVVPSLKMSDAMIKIENNTKINHLNRENYRVIQTPQICNYKDLLNTHNNLKSNTIFNDESSLLIHNNLKVKLIEGDPRSIKITYKKDFELVKSIIKKNYMKKYITKIGIGYDVHKLIKVTSKTKDKNLILGGIRINNGYYLKGHSDGDVLLHSIADSIYGALNEHDIGYYFPPSDEKWKNSDSFIFLNHALKKLEEQSGKIINIDSVIITETPKILDYVNDIKNKISSKSTIDKSILSIKGKSNEGIGFIGRKEGISVFSNTTIQLPDE